MCCAMLHQTQLVSQHDINICSADRSQHAQALNAFPVESRQAKPAYLHHETHLLSLFHTGYRCGPISGPATLCRNE